MTEQQDLWNLELNDQGFRAPFTLLREQADLLKTHTHGRVLGEVQVFPESTTQLRADLFLRVPRLGNYRLLVMSVLSDARETYPVRVLDQLRPGGPHVIDCPGESSYVEAVKLVLGQPETKAAIQNLFVSAGP